MKTNVYLSFLSSMILVCFSCKQVAVDDTLSLLSFLANSTSATSSTVSISVVGSSGIQISASSLSLTHGTNTNFSIRLASQPSTDVTIAFSFNGSKVRANGSTTSPVNLTFTTSNYGTIQSLTLAMLSNTNDTDTLSIATTSIDSNYNGLSRSISMTLNATAVPTYTIGGTLTQLGPSSVVLQNNGADNLSLTSNGSFTFSSSIASGGTYSVSVLTQPSGQNCIVSSPTGTVSSANVTSVLVTCTGNSNGALSSGTIMNALPTLGAGGVSTFVGPACCTGSSGYVDSTTVTDVRFNAPSAITTDGYNLYIADRDNHKIRKVVIATGATTTLAGSGQGNFDATGTSAQFDTPRGVTTDGVYVYVSDDGNNAIRRVEITTGIVTTLNTGGITTPRGMTIYNNNLYITDGGSSPRRLMQMSLSSPYTLTTVINSGLSGPRGIILLGTDIYISDFSDHTIKKTSIGTWTVSTFAGTSATSGNVDGTGTGAQFNSPDGITTDGTSLFVVQEGTDQLRKITVPGAVVSTLAGDGTAGYVNSGTSTSARFNNPRGLTSDGSAVYVMDRGNHVIRKIN